MYNLQLMARKHEAASLLRSGCSPPEIAERMGISLTSVVGYLYNQVGEGKISRSDILFSISKETREAIDEMARRGADPLTVRMQAMTLPRPQREEALLYLDLRKPQVYLQDMYWVLFALELWFHGHIKQTLVREFGSDWWRKGIPEKIRADCAAARERDPEPAAEPYCYTTLGHLKDIFDARWQLFSKTLPRGPAAERRQFLSGLARLNSIRNRVMHPAKHLAPEEEDFRFVREFHLFALGGVPLGAEFEPEPSSQ